MIYKPSHCSPSLSTISLGAETTFFECVLDSSNTDVEGFSLTVWGPDGEVIFPKTFTTVNGATMPYITKVSDLRLELSNSEFSNFSAETINNGLNGSLLRFPFIYNKKPDGLQTYPDGSASVTYRWDSETCKYNCLLPTFVIGSKNASGEIIDLGVEIANQKTYLSRSPWFTANHFVYTNGQWVLGGNTVSLNNYGITYSETPTDGDEIIISFTAQDWQGNIVYIYSGLTYKWAITLFHLDEDGRTPTELDQYDTQVASGTVLGSNNGRIQAAYSDNIYSGYYIQPLYIPGLDVTRGYEDWRILPSVLSGNTTADTIVTNALTATDTASASPRAKIDEYDYSYGFIYPEQYDFALPAGIISPPTGANDNQRANAFQIYKYTNNYFQADSGNRVIMCPDLTIVQDKFQWVNKGEEGYLTLTGVCSGFAGSTVSTDSAPYRVYQDAQRGEFYPFAGNITSSSSVYPGQRFPPLANGDLVMIEFPEGSTNVYYNGIYSFSATYTDKADMYGSVDSAAFTYTFKRAPSANSWNSLLNSAYCIASSSLNSSYIKHAGEVVTLASGLSSTVAPILNQIAIQLKAEEPIQIYNYPELSFSNGTTPQGYVSSSLRNTIGIINYNYSPYTTAQAQPIPGRLFIRPSRGVEAGMRLVPDFYVNGEPNTTDIIIGATKKLNNIDAVSYVEYTTLPSALTSYFQDATDKLKYNIQTFFTRGDENYFTVEQPPTLTFTVTDSTFAGSSGSYTPDTDGVYQIDLSRGIKILASYNQSQFVSWRSFQFHLIESNQQWEKLRILKSYPERYDSRIEVDIQGLTGKEYGSGKYYLVLLQGESITGLPFEYKIRLQADFSEEDVPVLSNAGASQAFTAVFNSKNNCVDLTVKSESTSGEFSIYRRELWFSEEDSAPGANLLYSPVTLRTPLLSVGSVQLSDYNIQNKCLYDYLVVKREGAGAPTSFRISVKSSWIGWSLCELLPQSSDVSGYQNYMVDTNNIWKFKYNVSIGDYTQQMQRTSQDTMGKFAQIFAGPKQSVSGQVQCLLGEIANVSGETVYSNYTRQVHAYGLNGTSAWSYSTTQLYNGGGYKEYPTRRLSSNAPVDLLSQWRNVCFSSNPKLIRDEKGQSFIVSINSASCSLDNTVTSAPASTSFDWEQIGDPGESIISSAVVSLVS